MKKTQGDPVVRRWGFYSANRLAFAGVALQSGDAELRLRLIEAEHLAHTATLPERIGLEQLVREMARSDIQQTMGPEWKVLIQFDPRKLSEHKLATDVFGASQPRTLPGS